MTSTNKDIDKLMLLPYSAQEKHQAAVKENQELESALRAQLQIIDDLSSSVSESATISKSISEIDAKISEIDEALRESQSTLIDLLNCEFEEQSSVGNDVLKTVLSNITDELSAITLGAVKEGELSVSLTDIIEVECKISNIIGTLNDKGLYKETNEQKKERIEKTQSHLNILSEFFKKYK